MPDTKGNVKASEIVGRVGDPAGAIRAGGAVREDYYIAPARVVLNEAGQVIGEGSEESGILLVPKGGLLPKSLALELRLADDAPADEVPPGDDAPGDDNGDGVIDALERLTAAELRERAKSLNVDGVAGLNKAALIGAVRAAEGAGAETGAGASE